MAVQPNPAKFTGTRLRRLAATMLAGLVIAQSAPLPMFQDTKVAEAAPLAPSVALAPPAAADEINGVVWLDLNGDGVNDATETGFTGAVVSLFDNTGTLVGTRTTTATGVYSFTGLDPAAGPFRVDVTRSTTTYADPSNWVISATGPSAVSSGYVGTDNDFAAQADQRFGSASNVMPGTQLDAAVRPRVELGLGFFGPGVIDGGGGYNSLGGCATATETAQAGDDCGPSNGQLRTQDVLSTVWSITADNFEPGTPNWGDVIFEQTIVPTGGAVLNFESIPVACVPPPNGTGGTGTPVSAILNNYPVAGQTTLRCNLGKFVEGGQESLTTAIKLSGLSPNGSSFTTTQQVYVAGDRAVPEAGPGVGPITASSRPAYDLVKLPFRNLDATIKCVDTDGNPATPCETLRGYHTYTIVRVASSQKTGVEAVTQPIVIKDNTSALLGDGVTPYPGFEFYIDECYPNPSGWGDVVLGNNYGYTKVAYLAQYPRTIDNSGTCTITRSNPADNTSDYTFSLTGGDYSGNRYPQQTWGGVDLSAGPFIAVEHRVRVFIPFRTIDMSDGVINDSGSVQLFNQYEGFDPVGVSGVSNFGDGVEPGYCDPADSTCDLMSNGTGSNNAVGPLAMRIAASGSWQKYQAYRSNDGLGYSYGSGQSTLRDAAMVAEPGDYNYAFIDMFNSGSVDLANQRVCDVFDNRTQILTSSANAGATASDSYGPLTNSEYAWVSAYDWVSTTTAGRRAFQAQWQVEYASIPVSNADDPLYNPARVGVSGVMDSAAWPGVDTFNPSTGRYEGVWTEQRNIRCDDAAAAATGGWQTDPNAVPGGITAVNAVRLIPKTAAVILEPGARIRFNIPFQVLSRYNGGPHDGELIPAGSVFANFGGVRNDQLDFGAGAGAWSPRNYQPSPLSDHGDGDRTTVGRFSSLLQKHTLTPATNVGVNGATLAGNQIVWEIIPSITATVVPTAQVAENTKIIDVLPPYTSYNATCTAALNSNPATATILPALVEPNTGQTGPQAGYTRLTYNLGSVPANVGIARIRLCTDTDPLAPNGTQVTNYSVLVADGDITTPALRSDTHSITLEQTGSMQISKNVDRRLDPINDTQVYTVEYANFAPAFQISPPTVIDVFPWNGDGPGSLSERDPVSSYTGTLQLQAAPTITFKNGSVPGAGDPFAAIGTFTYTKDAAATVNYNPDLNTSTWCLQSAFGTPGCPASFAEVTAFKFVSNYSLDRDGLPRQGHKITFTLNAAGNKPGDKYTNRATIDSASLPASQFLRSNNVVVEVASFNLGDRLFADINHDGNFDAGTDRPAPADVTVNVYRDGDTTPYATVVTNANGRYEFTALPAGDYWVEVPATMFAAGAPLYGWMAQLTPAADADDDRNDTVDHDATNITAGTGTGGIRSSVVTLSATVPASPLISPTGNEPFSDNTGGLIPLIGDDFTNYTVDLALVGTSSIGDRVWFDTDGDGVQDLGESGLNNALVTAIWLGWDGVAGGGDDVTFTSTTSADGNWLIDDIPGGKYTVTVTAIDSDLAATFDLDGTATAGTTAVTLPDGADRRDVDFGYTARFTLGNRVFADANHDGNFDAGIDVGIANVTVQLFKDGSLTPAATTVTDSNGNYSFTGLVAGDYYVRIPNAELTVGDLVGHSVSPNGSSDPNNDTDETGDHNAFEGLTGGAMTAPITLSATLTAATGSVVSNEPAGSYTNNTLDLGFIPPVKPGIHVEKTTNGFDADTGTGPYITVGGTVTWRYTVTNTGDVALGSISVTDDAGTAATGDDWTMTKTSGYLSGDLDNDGLLDLAEIWTFEHTGVAVAGQYGNIGTSTGDPSDPSGVPIPGQPNVTDTDPSHYLGATASIDIEKFVQTLYDADTAAAGPTVATGSATRFSYVVTNTGNTVLTNVTVTDDIIGAITCPATRLNPGATMTCYAIGVAVTGAYLNTGTATGTPTDPDGSTIPGLANPTDTDVAHYNGADPAIDIEKFVQTNHDADTSGSGPLVDAAGTVSFTYVVTNTGNTVLTDVKVTDNVIGAITCPETQLAPAESMTCVITGIPAIDAGEYVNVGTSTGTGPTTIGPNGEVVPGEDVTDTDTAHYTPAAPAIDVQKFVQAIWDSNTQATAPAIAEGGPVRFTYVVTNTGNVALTEVELTDDIEGVITCPSDALAVGEQMTCTFDAVATGDNYTNIGSVTAVGPDTVGELDEVIPGRPVSDTDPANYFGVNPGLSIDKFVQTTFDANTAATGPNVAAGDTVRWSYTVRNTGNVPLTDVVVVDDQLLDDQIINCGLGAQNAIPALAVGQSVTCVAFGTAITGPYANIGSVTGTGPVTVGVDGNPTVPGETLTDQDPANYFGMNPVIHIETAVQTTFDADTATGAPLIGEGNDVVITYTVTNPGNVPLTDVTVADTDYGTPVYQSGDTNGDGKLDTTETWVFVSATFPAGTPGIYQATGTTTGTGPDTINAAGGTVPGADVTDSDPHFFEVPNIGVHVETFVADTHDADTTASGPVVGSTGQVEITYVVTNTGIYPLTDVVLADTDYGTPVYQSGDTNGDGKLDPTETWTYTVLTDPFVTAPGESIAATATVTGTGPATVGTDGTPVPGDNVTDTDDHHWSTIAPGVDIETSVQTLFDADTAGTGPLVAVTSDVLITYTVTNTGDAPLAQVVVTDSALGVPTYVSGDLDGDNLLDLDETWVYTLTVPANTPGANSATGTVTGVAPATIDGATGTTVPGVTVTDLDAHHFNVAAPAVDVEKFVQTLFDADTAAAGPLVDADGQVRFTYVVTNTGNTDLNPVTVTDSVEGAITCPATTLAAGQAMTCELTVDAVTAGAYTNTATVTGVGPDTIGTDGTPVDGDEVTDTDVAHYFSSTPAVTIKKSVQTTFDANVPATGPLVAPAAPVQWTYEVTNTGNVPLTDVTVTDDQIADDTTIVCGAGTTNLIGTMAPGDKVLCTATGTALSAGSYVNIGSVTGTGPETFDVDGTPVPGEQVSSSNPAHYTVSTPQIGLETTVQTTFDADTNSSYPLVDENGDVLITYTVTNEGNTPLSDVTVADTTFGTPVYSSGDTDGDGLLDLGEVWIYTITVPAGAAGEVSSSATATGTGPDTIAVDGSTVPGVTVTDTDPHGWFTVHPEIGLETTVQTTFDADTNSSYPLVDENGDVLITYTVTNEGNTPLSDVTVADTTFGTPVYSSGDTDGDGLLDLGEVWIYTITVPAGAAGEVSSSATATGTGPDTIAVDGSTVPGVTVTDTDPHGWFSVHPAIDIEKLVQTLDADTTGDAPKVGSSAPVRFTYLVTNTGNVPLTDVAVVDDIEGAIVCPATALAAGAQMTCTLETVAVIGDYTNVGTVTGVGPDTVGPDGTPVPGEPVTDNDPANYFGVRPSVEVVKSVQGMDANTKASGPAVAGGSPVKFTYLVTNTGNVPLTDVAVVDDIEGAIVCPATALAAGAQMTCTLETVAVIGDYTNVGTVTGVGPDTVGPDGTPVPGEPVTDNDPANYTGGVPAIDIVKYINGVDANEAPGVVVEIGKPAVFRYVVKNISSVTIDEVAVTDDVEGPIGCPQRKLAAGETMVCEITVSSLAAGAYRNTGTVTGVGPGTVDPDGNPVPGITVKDSDVANAYVAVSQVVIKKYVNGLDADTAADAASITAGSTVTFTYVVTNTGNVDLVDLKMSDDRGVRIDCGSGTASIGRLAPGGSVTCSGTDIAVAGPYNNTGMVTATPIVAASPDVVLSAVTASDMAHYAGLSPTDVAQSPTTGAASTTLMLIGMSVLLAGIGLAAITRRRRRTA